MTTDVKRVFVVLACAALLAPAAFARSTARVSVPDLTPFTVHGSGFVSREHVTVVVSAKGIHRTHLVTAGAAPAYLPLASGYVALTVPTSEQQGVAGHITLGDYITVIASANVTLFQASGQQQGPPKAVTKTVFWNIRVIGVGPAQINVQPAAGTSTSTTQAPTTGGVTSSLTIEMTQCEAEYMVWFLNNTQLRYTLESVSDYLKLPPTAPDTGCPSIQSASGVSNKDIEQKFHFTTA